MNNTPHFCVKIDFEKDSKHPERVFKTMSRLIESVESMQNMLSISLSLSIKRNLLLHEIETGSLLAWLKAETDCSKDEDIKISKGSEKTVEKYLDKGVEAVVDFTSERNKINSIEEIYDLQENLHKLAEDTKIKNIPAYSKISEKELLEIIFKNSEASKFLSNNDDIYFVFNGKNKKYNKKFSITKKSINRILTKKSQIKEEILELMVKKPDYIGNSMWEFKLNGKSIDAKLSHDEWLESFHQREKNLKPGDSLKAVVEVKTAFSHKLEVIDINYNIKEVIEIVKQPYPVENGKLDLRQI